MQADAEELLEDIEAVLILVRGSRTEASSTLGPSSLLALVLMSSCGKGRPYLSGADECRFNGGKLPINDTSYNACVRDTYCF